MVGTIAYIGKTAFMVVNDQGTLERLPQMRWYRELWLYVISRFKTMTIDEIRSYVKGK